jgi:general stress protein YciG
MAEIGRKGGAAAAHDQESIRQGGHEANDSARRSRNE